jgi:hypothetical protein
MLLDTVPNPGASEWGEATLLGSFRNHLMHFKPKWESVDSEPRKPAETFKKKFGVAEAYKGSAICPFPHACFTYKCAKWSVETVLKFSKSFSQTLGIEDRFGNWQPPTPLP